MTAIQEYAIAAGYNNAAGLQRIETITDGTGKAFRSVRVNGYAPGEARVRANGTIGLVGFPTVRWFCGGITWAQYAYLRDNILAGAYSGPVTIRTRLDDNDYYNCNAILTLGFSQDLTIRSRHYVGFEYVFTKVEVL